ncbi:hypothetical protein PP175_14555 [Aneurinibacillus sp. Ricciae_BoGa-3]|uniref:hypothetical protein n=1 Tax=Aneurinibacillus sp. Ricciae_BoGa-3 TaxID=3022697 RepID=UPI002341368E|nr:hypothetical protein [Aneurinibacillus sp. Ricciae_BoGa-3]WCK52652.1 hypothetical protein PP175_14555 [Aneurinibacillus sp. Ricciae_BoGa-3]
MDTEKNQQVSANVSNIVAELANPEVQEALAGLIQKLPQIKGAVDKAEQGVAVAAAFANDNQSLNSIFEGISSISKLASKENLEALTTIIDSLPRIASMVTLLDSAAAKLEPILSNKDYLSNVMEAATVIAAPVTEKVQDSVSMVKEAKERAERNDTTISLFGMLKLLKEPGVQKGLKFTQAMLDVMNEKKVLG